ncbi:MAG: TonB-dependent receptor [Sphingomonadales bacterium]|nr:TonB-dependent receptor [Sphingomonadales bacterium]MDE2569782.1 TonB-dependent receptor [Sphingomonadales bacterium]
MKYRHIAMATTALLSIAGMASPAIAAEDQNNANTTGASTDAGAADDYGAIVVTAQKRSESIQTIPLSIMAVDSKGLESRNIVDVKGLATAIPSLTVGFNAQAAGVALRIRGFGASANSSIDPSVAPYLDGVFIPRPGAIVTSFLDVSSIEVLRGPQGTLFGRNATVGAISIHTNEPSFSGISGHVSAEAGTYGRLKGEAVLNLPVSDTLAVRFAGLGTSFHGYAHNAFDGKTYGGQDTTAGRFSLKWEPSNSVKWVFRADYSNTNGDGVTLSQIDTSTATPTQLARLNATLGPLVLTYPPTWDANQRFSNIYLSDSQWGVASDLNIKFGGYTLRLIDSYRDWKNRQGDGDTIYSTLDMSSRDGSFRSKSNSHELQFLSPENELLGGRFDFVVGLYYAHEDFITDEGLNIGSQLCGFFLSKAPAALSICRNNAQQTASYGLFTQSSTSKAGYLQANYKLTDAVKLTAGMRQTWDSKHATMIETLANPAIAILKLRAAENTALPFKDNNFSWRANVSWDAARDVMFFLTYSTGYKSGGINSAFGFPALGAKRIFKSEESRDWELGVKSRLFDRRLTLNATLFRTDLDNLQERSFDGSSFLIRNAGSVRAQGVELETQANLTQNVQVDVSGAYLDSYYTSNTAAPGLPGCTGLPGSCPLVQDLTGHRSTNAPEWQGNFGLQYTTPEFGGGLTTLFRINGSYVSSTFTQPDASPQSVLQGVFLLSGRIVLNGPNDKWSLALFGDNLANRHYFAGTLFPQVLDAPLGLRDSTTGYTVMRGYVGAPRTVGVKATYNF